MWENKTDVCLGLVSEFVLIACVFFSGSPQRIYSVNLNEIIKFLEIKFPLCFILAEM